MRILVLYAHPVETSYNACLHRTVVDTLTARGHEVADVDLNAEGFDPRMSREERLGYHDTATNAAPVQRYVDLMRWAEGVVFCFPVWCFGVPAILKGFFDRVLMPGVAFELSADGGRVRPLLTNIRRVAAVTTYGRPWWMVRLSVGDLPRTHICRYFRWFCARDVRLTYPDHYHMNVSTDATRTSFREKVARAMMRF